VTELDDRERLDIATAAAILGLRPSQARWYHWRRGFCAPAGTDGGHPFWYENDLFRWAGGSGRKELLRRTPLRFWPDAREKATYRGGSEFAEAFVQEWSTGLGSIAVFWPLRPHGGPSAREAAEHFQEFDSLVRVASDFGRDGPTIGTAQPGSTNPEWADFAARWSDLSRVLGQPAPYWPFYLRIPKLMTDWTPGSATVVYLPIPEVDVTPLLRLAIALADGEPAQQVLMHLARVAQRRAVEGAVLDLELVEETHNRRRGVSLDKTTMIAARPMLFPEPEEIIPSAAQDGWNDVLSRSDLLALECLRVVGGWDGGAYFKYASTETIRVNSRYGAEWARRLRSVEDRTAFHEYLSSQLGPKAGRSDPMVDPVSGTPVLQNADGTLTVAVPQRLTNDNGELAEVILDRPIWVRTSNGVLQLAPQHHYYGINWGYSGSGPGSLALLIDRLLDDIAASAADAPHGAPDGLDRLTELKWPQEQVLTREMIEAAREGRPYERPAPRLEEDDS